MTPDFEQMNERMEQASLDELAPGFDKEQEWMKISEQLHKPKWRILLPVWSYAAAILLLLAGGAWLWLVSDEHGRQSLAQQHMKEVKDTVAVTAPVRTIDSNKKVVRTEEAPAAPATKADKSKQDNKTIRNTVAVKKHRANAAMQNNAAKEVICNGTPCPIQICISQTMRCPNVQPAAISSCSTLEPDQSGRLSYKEHDKIARNCSLTVNEIEIKSIATGEVILLNANSKPATAQEVFSYITGQKKGDVLAGMFNSDCNDKTKKKGLRLYNSYGNIIIQ